MFAYVWKAFTQPARSSKRRRAGAFYRLNLEALEHRNLPSLASAITTSIEGQLTGPKTGDFNGDGKADLVMVNPTTANVIVVLNNGNGTFGSRQTYPGGTGADAVAVADLNGDGKADLIVADYGSNTTANSGGVSILLGNGNGTFQNPVFIPTGSQPRLVLARDFNGDGKIDLALASDYVANFTTAGSVDVLLGNGDGTFQSPAHYAVTPLPNSLVVGDFNGDAKQDLAVASAGAAPLSVLLGNGDGTFQPALTSGLGTVAPVSLTAADFNNDGKTDLAMIDSVTGLVAEALSNGNGTFQTPVALNVGAATRVVATPLTTGGNADVIVIGGGLTGQVTVLKGNGDGTFQTPAVYGAGVVQPDGLTIADLNGDGRADVAVVSSTTGTVGVLFNVAPPQLQFSAAGYSVNESTPTATITVTLTGTNAGTVTVNYATSNGTAQAGVDYQAASGSLTWTNGDTTAKTFTIPILNNPLASANKTVNLTLSSPGGTALLGGQASAVLTITSNHFPVDKLLGQVAESGQWWLARPGATGVTSTAQGNWAPDTATLTWVDVMTGDFNGDGHTDVIGMVQQTGQWWVSLSTSSGFITYRWVTWGVANWVNVMVGDFNGDGKSDIVGQNKTTGQWWVGLSTGTSFTDSLWATWATTLTWVNVMVGDLNGDGKADIVGMAQQTGQWWTGISTGTAFQTALWATWAPNSTGLTWVNVQLGDLNGDGRADIIGRVLQSGEWWAGISTGASFATSLWGHWSTAVSWTDVMLGDVNGDGRMDLVGRVVQSGQWWVGLSTGSSLSNALWATWSSAVTWVDVQLGDFNGDGKLDIIGRPQGSGVWYLGASTGSSFATSIYTIWSNVVTWDPVLVGHFA